MNLSELTKPHVRQWILEHEHDEPAQLMLQAHRFSGIPVREAVAQIQARQKVRSKLPYWHSRPDLLYPPSLSVEQSSSEETGLYKAALVQGNAMADLTGGMGADTFYLGRNCPEAYYVEQQEVLCRFASHNFKALNVPHIQVINSSAEDYLKSAPPLDFIYLDPARRGEGNQKLYKLADCQPDVSALLPELFRRSNTILLKAAPMLDISQGLSELEGVKEVHVVGVKGEVKELLFLMQAGYKAEARIVAVNLKPGNEEAFSFTFTEEQEAVVSFAEPGQYLFEPHAALLKAGAFRLVAQRYGLAKLHTNSHLYTANILPGHFPGRSFKILYSGKPDKKILEKLLPEGKAMISTRNHPLSVQQLVKKLKIKEGGNLYLFGTTFSGGKPGIVVCARV